MIAYDAVAFRRELHSAPEVGLDLPRTRRRVLEALYGLGLEITEGRDSSSIVAVLRGGTNSGRRSVLLRADMDALPVEERSALPWASRNGAMHACGHDLHTAMLIGAAHALAARRSELGGDVVFAFQAGEEALNGARIMIAEGALDAAGPLPIAALGLHVRADALPGGVFGFRDGVVTGTGTSVRADFFGRGGHGSAPHTAVDPIPALLEGLTAVQVALAREIDAFDSVVFTPGSVHAGTRRNVIPDAAHFEATLRTFDESVRQDAVRIIGRVLAGVAAAHNTRVEVLIEDGYPSVVNDTSETTFASGILTRLFGSESHERMPHAEAMTEDFSRFAQRIPAFFAFLGACPPKVDWRTAPSNHSSEAVFDDAVLSRGIAFETEWAVARLADQTEATP
ncbi:hippurate hydrolase [Conyzicola lurida]|uniref:Hippurate hydrolase n=1 Tax=Conyzicola lurida TaxID=1172621 RepID=A0A841AL08_9MICO|nr:hippurate hydrolase [Conyzicola lurida]